MGKNFYNHYLDYRDDCIIINNYIGMGLGKEISCNSFVSREVFKKAAF